MKTKEKVNKDNTRLDILGCYKSLESSILNSTDSKKTRLEAIRILDRLIYSPKFYNKVSKEVQKDREEWINQLLYSLPTDSKKIVKLDNFIVRFRGEDSYDFYSLPEVEPAIILEDLTKDKIKSILRDCNDAYYLEKASNEKK